jgi:N-acetylgalactosamine-6-sulfatase
MASVTTFHSSLVGVFFAFGSLLNQGYAEDVLSKEEFGHPSIKTPNLDKLAARGMLFTDFTVAAPTCSPSRAAILSSQFPARLEIHTYIAGVMTDKGNAAWLDPDFALLPKAFRDAGYRTALYGKWHLGGGGPPWERETDPPAPEVSAYYYEDHAITRSGTGDRLRTNPNPGDLPEGAYSAAIVDHAIDFLGDHPNEPVFLHLNFFDPHSTLAPTEAERRKHYPEYAAFGGRAERYESEYGVTGFTTPEEVYYTSVTRMDEQIGRFLDYLEANDRLDDTLILFLSDNGPEVIGGSASYHSTAGSAGPFRAGKASIYEGGLRSPFVVSWPDGGVPEGEINRQAVVSAVDLLPSLASWLELPLPKGTVVDGEDLHSLFLGYDKNRTNPLFWENLETPRGVNAINQSPSLAIRDGKWKLLMNHDGTRTELYDLKTDPSESVNLAEVFPERVQRMAAMLIDWTKELPGDRDSWLQKGQINDPWLRLLKGEGASGR